MTTDELQAIRTRFDSGLSLEYDETEALLAEVERLRAEVAATLSRCAHKATEDVQRARQAAYRRGAEAMREAAAVWLDWHASAKNLDELDTAIRALPLPKEGT